LLLSIVIPAFNEEKVLADTLQRIVRAMNESIFDTAEFEMIVCDNNSTDRTAAIAESFGARVVFEERNQISLARNRGAQKAIGDWLLFIDADSYPNSELLNDVHELILQNEYAGGGSTMVFSGQNTKRASFVLALVNIWMRVANFAAGAFFLCKAKDFLEVGGFNTSLYASEEIDLAKKIKLASTAPRKRFKILHKHPFYTSSRKFELYSAKERRELYWSIIFNGRKIFKDKSKLSIWYDGRR